MSKKETGLVTIWEQGRSSLIERAAEEQLRALAEVVEGHKELVVATGKPEKAGGMTQLLAGLFPDLDISGFETHQPEAAEPCTTRADFVALYKALMAQQELGSVGREKRLVLAGDITAFIFNEEEHSLTPVHKRSRRLGGMKPTDEMGEKWDGEQRGRFSEEMLGSQQVGVLYHVATGVVNGRVGGLDQYIMIKAKSLPKELLERALYHSHRTGLDTKANVGLALTETLIASGKIDWISVVPGDYARLAMARGQNIFDVMVSCAQPLTGRVSLSEESMLKGPSLTEISGLGNSAAEQLLRATVANELMRI